MKATADTTAALSEVKGQLEVATLATADATSMINVDPIVRPATADTHCQTSESGVVSEGEKRVQQLLDEERMKGQKLESTLTAKELALDRLNSAMDCSSSMSSAKIDTFQLEIGALNEQINSLKKSHQNEMIELMTRCGTCSVPLVMSRYVHVCSFIVP